MPPGGFIRSFGVANEYTMPWSECGELRQCVRHCRGYHPNWAWANPGSFALRLCSYYQPLFTVDPGILRVGFDWDTREHTPIRAEWPLVGAFSLRAFCIIHVIPFFLPRPHYEVL